MKELVTFVTTITLGVLGAGVIAGWWSMQVFAWYYAALGCLMLILALVVGVAKIVEVNQ